MNLIGMFKILERFDVKELSRNILPFFIPMFLWRRKVDNIEVPCFVYELLNIEKDSKPLFNVVNNLF